MKMYKIFFIILVLAINCDFGRISFKSMRVRLLKHKGQAYKAVGKAYLAKKVLSSTGDIFFNSIMDTITKELEIAGYTLLDKSFEGILELLTSLEAEQEITRGILEKSEEIIHAILFAFSIPIGLSAMCLIITAIFLRRLYVQTHKFMENTVKRVKEMKRATTILVRRLDAIKPDEKENLIEPMYQDLNPKKTKI